MMLFCLFFCLRRWGGYCLLVVNVFFVWMFSVSVMCMCFVVFVVGCCCFFLGGASVCLLLSVFVVCVLFFWIGLCCFVVCVCVLCLWAVYSYFIIYMGAVVCVLLLSRYACLVCACLGVML